MSNAGRKPKISSELIDRICGYVANGAFFRGALALCGVGSSTAYDWLKKGREEKRQGTLYAEFVQAKAIAEARFEQFHIQNINVQSKNSWQASAWMLERKFPERYGRNRRISVGDGGSTADAGAAAKIVLYLPDNRRDVED